jgi:TonB-linked SusC/RagA family outer membrane protein
MNYIRNFLLIISLLFLNLEIMAQVGGVIRGQIKDKTTGESLPGVNIVELDNQNRIVNGRPTDINGNYVLEVTDINHNIQVSYLGYNSQTFKINSRTIINIELEQKTEDIEGVRIVAKTSSNTLTGVSLRDQGGAVTQVNMDELSGLSTATAADALQGQVAGLDILAASGNPGSGSSMVIRGMGTLGNANPLIVVDGIPQDIKIQDFNFASADQHDLGQLLNIAPQDIKSVTVLKDAASTAVWGSKGANGVLIIETQQGISGKIKFNYEYKFSANVQPPLIPMLNGDEYITLQLEEWHNYAGIYDISKEIAYDKNYINFYNYSANTDWIDEITRTSFTHDHFFKLSGGSNKSRYYTSFNYYKELGTTINTAFRRFSVRSNFDYRLSDKLLFTINFSYSNTFREDNPKDIRSMAYIKSPNMSVWEYDENGNLTGEYFTPIVSYQGDGSTFFNPVAVSDLGENNIKGNEIQNNFVVEYDILDWMKFQESVSFSFYNEKGNRFIPGSAIGADWLDNAINEAEEQNSLNIRWMSRSQLFLQPFKQSTTHSLIGVLMWEMEQKEYDWMTLFTDKSPSTEITDPAAGSPYGYMGSGISQSVLLGAFASLNYKFKDRYMFNFNVRSDGSSSFGAGNRWGTFPSLWFAWRFSEESFMDNLTFLSDGKLRISWGQSGKGISDPYATYSYYASSGQYMENPAIIPTQIELANLKWQTVGSWNGGVDLGLFNNRIYITAEIYNSVTKDLLWETYDIPGSSGFNRLGYFNGGQLQNTGWEFYMRGAVIDHKDLKLSLSFNISRNINSFLSFPENFLTVRGSSIGNGVYPRKAEIGKPIGSFYGFRYLGVYPTDEDAIARNENGDILIDGNGNPIYMTYQGTYKFQGGDAIYEDVNHDGKIDLMDAVYLGDSNPEITGGFNTSIKYKQFSASFDFFYRLGYDIVNQVAIETEGMLDKNNQSTAVLHRWRWYGQDEEGLLPRAFMNHPCNNLGSDRYVERGDFLRLNNVVFMYRLGENITQKLHLSGVDLGINIRKLFTITRYTGQDPEIGRVEKDPFWLGLDNARTPTPKIYSFRILLNF